MFQILMNEIDTWPAVLQTVIDHAQTATVIVPVISLLVYACCN